MLPHDGEEVIDTTVLLSSIAKVFFSLLLGGFLLGGWFLLSSSLFDWSLLNGLLDCLLNNALLFTSVDFGHFVGLAGKLIQMW